MDKRERWLEAEREVDEIRETLDNGSPLEIYDICVAHCRCNNPEPCPIHGDRLDAISARYDQLTENELSRGE